MVVLRNLLIILLVGVLVFHPALQPVADATVATGAVTGRGVFSLTASGAAKIGLAEAQVAQAVRALGMLGKLSGAITVGFVAYQISSGLWDWWQSTYDAGTALSVGPAGPANFGVTAGAGVGDCVWGVRQTSPTGTAYYYDVQASSSCPGGYTNQYVVVGQSYTSYVNGEGWVIGTYWRHFVLGGSLPGGATSHNDVAAGESGRDAAVAAIDSGLMDLTMLTEADQVMIAAQAGQIHPFTGPELDALEAILQAARNVISSGVELTADDATVVDAGASTGSMPGEIPGTGETTSGDSTAAALAAVSAAIAASGAAVVSAVNAVAAAVAASAVAIYTPIVAAVTASQAAVVSAVQAIAAPIVTAIDEAKTAIVSAVASAPAGGGSAGTTTAVESLAAQETARNAAAESAAAASQAPAVVCPVCVRDDKWSEAWGTLSAAGQAAPVFGLINRIVINPVGTIQRVQTVSTANFGVMTFDLNAWGIDTYIGVIRYVVIFVALMAGYFVIFG